MEGGKKMSLQPLFEMLTKLQQERDIAYKVLYAIQDAANDDNTLAIGENLPIAKI
jgi:hypothetical protein